LAVFFKVLILESTSNFLNLPKLRGKVTLALSYYVYDKLMNLQTKYLIFWSCDPLEQFDIIIFPAFLTSPSIFIIFILLFLYSNFKVNDTFILYNKNISIFILLGATRGILKDNLHVTKNYAFFYICALFLIILVCNCLGMIPYTFTVTSSLIVTFFLAAMFFGGVNLIGVFTHG
jgi:F-type H+-transporting ATPase subunit a